MSDLGSFARVYEDYFSKIYSYVYYRIRVKSDVEDIVSNVFLKAFNKYSSFKGDNCKILPWLYTIAHNEVVSFYRKNKKVIINIEDISNLAGDFNVEDIVYKNIMQKNIIDALYKTTLEQQDALILYYIQDLKIREVAKILGKSENAVKALVYRGLKSMKKILLCSSKRQGYMLRSRLLDEV